MTNQQFENLCLIRESDPPTPPENELVCVCGANLYEDEETCRYCGRSFIED